MTEKRPEPSAEQPGPPWTVIAYSAPAEPGPVEVRTVLKECDDDDDLRWWLP